MMKRRVCQCIALVLLSCVAAYCGPIEGPDPLWTVNLKPLGYKQKHIGRKTMVRFWDHFVVVEQISVPIVQRDDKTHKKMLVTDPAPPARWVFDLRDHKQVPETAIAGANWEPLPEISPWPDEDSPNEVEFYVTARWKNMTITRYTWSGNMYLDEPGQERKAICYGNDQCFRGNMVFVSERRFASGSDYMAMDAIGKRYARYETYLDGFGAHLLENITMGDCGEHNWAAVTVFSAETDKQLFVYRWKERGQERIAENEPFTQYNRLIALSHDGRLLAVVRRSELALIQLPDHK